MFKVLIVDDATIVRYSLKKILERSGYEVVGEAENGIAAVNKFKELKPDLVTMDITMPQLDGIGALQMIKNIDSKAKVIMISAMGQERLVRESIMSGAAGFIVKPFKDEVVLDTLSKVTG